MEQSVVADKVYIRFCFDAILKVRSGYAPTEASPLGMVQVFSVSDISCDYTNHKKVHNKFGALSEQGNSRTTYAAAPADTYQGRQGRVFSCHLCIFVALRKLEACVLSTIITAICAALLVACLSIRPLLGFPLH